jgi:hypothetical protein
MSWWWWIAVGVVVFNQLFGETTCDHKENKK